MKIENGIITTLGGVKLFNTEGLEAVVREIEIDDVYRIDDIPTGSLVMDIGAFCGEFALICRDYLGCCVAAFEPSPENFAKLQNNIELNSGGFIIYEKPGILRRLMAIRGTEELATFCMPAGHPAGTRAISELEPMPPISFVQRSSTLTSEIEMAEDFFGKRPIVVKLDCEGSEKHIFEHDRTWIEQVDRIIMETHNHDSDTYAEILSDAGFIVELEGGGPKPRPQWDKSMAGGLLIAWRKK